MFSSFAVAILGYRCRLVLSLRGYLGFLIVGSVTGFFALWISAYQENVPFWVLICLLDLTPPVETPGELVFPLLWSLVGKSFILK